MASVFFFGGVAYDSLTLSRIDRLQDNLILMLYVSLLGAFVVLFGRFQLGLVPPAPSVPRWHPLRVIHRIRLHITKAIQFLLGGLLSAYLYFYFQSTSFTTTAFFLVVIVLLLIANEFLHHRLSRLTLLLSLFAVVTFSFFNLFLPVITGWMNAGIFWIGVFLSAVVVWQVLRLIWTGASWRTRWEPFLMGVPAFACILILAGFYVLNWIPPVPLALKFGGMYHQVEKINGQYQLLFRDRPWYQFWKRSDDHFQSDEPAYCFTAVFAPVSLKTTIYHHWQYRPVSSLKPFQTTDRIPIPISGGREKGYRGYTAKQRLNPGEWRVNVETEDGHIIGRLLFQVKEKKDHDRSMRTILY